MKELSELQFPQDLRYAEDHEYREAIRKRRKDARERRRKERLSAATQPPLFTPESPGWKTVGVKVKKV